MKYFSSAWILASITRSVTQLTRSLSMTLRVNRETAHRGQWHPLLRRFVIGILIPLLVLNGAPVMLYAQPSNQNQEDRPPGQQAVIFIKPQVAEHWTPDDVQAQVDEMLLALADRGFFIIDHAIVIGEPPVSPRDTTCDDKKPVGPPVDKDGKPIPTPVKLPPGKDGQPNKWVPIPGSESRPTKWKPQFPVPNPGENGGVQPGSSWDPAGHWDVDNGRKSPRQRILPDGTIVDDQCKPLPEASPFPPFEGIDWDIVAMFAGFSAVVIVVTVAVVVINVILQSWWVIWS
jgi:hypothetical protein